MSIDELKMIRDLLTESEESVKKAQLECAKAIDECRRTITKLTGAILDLNITYLKDNKEEK